jgi:hypothetical protein
VRFSGVLRDLVDQPLAGPVAVHFAIYKDETDTAAIWEETQTLQLDEHGRYTVLLGATQPEGLPLLLFQSTEARWLGVSAGKLPEQPRILLVSVPYALKASDADTLGGKPASAYVTTDAASNSSGQSQAPGTTSVQGLVATAGQRAEDAASNPSTVVSGSGIANFLPVWTNGTTLGNSTLYEKDGKVGIGNSSPAGTLDVSGGAFIRGTLQLPASKTATKTWGFSSNPLDMEASAFNSGTSAAVAQLFRWQAEAVGNDTTSPSGKLNLLFASAGGSPAETGLSIASNGLLTFASGQTFPGMGTITGLTAGTDLTGGGTTGTVTLNLDTTKVPTLAATSNTFTGSVAAASFSGSGAGLTSLSPANLSAGTAGINISGNAATATTAASATTATTASNALSLGGVVAANYARLDIANSFTGNQSVSGNVSATGSVSGGTASFSGALTAAGAALPATGTATATQGYNSNPMDLQASSYSSGTSAAVPQLFRWQAEAAGNDTGSPSGTLNLLYLAGSGTPAETGLSIASNGRLTFAPGQTFPGGGGGTITGVTAGTDLTGGGSTGTVTLNLDTTKVPTLAATSNTFTGSIAATSFSGNGSALANLNPANLSAGTAGINISGNAATATTAASATNATTASNALSLGGVVAGNYARLDIGNSFTGNQSVSGNVSATGSVSGGTASFSGALTAAGAVLPATGTATASSGANSEPLDLLASSFDSTIAMALNQHFRWQVEAEGNNTASPAATLNLLFAPGSATPAETGLSIASNGQLSFASGQTFPGTGTVTSVGSGAGLTGGPITGSGTLSIATAGVTNAMLANPSLTVAAGTDLTGGGSVALGKSVTLNLDTSKVPTLAASSNTFTGSVTASSFSGNGSGLTNLNASNLTSGTLPSSVLSGTYSQALTFSNASNSFTGNGAGLTNLTPDNLSAGTAGISISGNAATATVATTAATATNALSLGGVVAGNYARLDIANSFTGNQSVTGNVSATGSVSGGTASFSGALTAAGAVLPATGTATATQGFNSNPMDLQASSYNSGTSAAVPQLFRWQAEPAGNNTASPSGTLNLLYLAGSGTPAETGLSIASNGQLTFASGQTFPGTGTVTSVGSGAGLTGGPITSSGTLSIATGGVTNAMLANPSLTVTAGTDLTGGGSVALGSSVTLNLDTSKVPTLGAASNTFTGSLTASGFTGSSGTFSGSTSPVVSGTNTSSGSVGQLAATVAMAGDTGVYGSGINYGVYGTSSAGTGVYASSGSGAGVYGSSASGPGVFGFNTTNNSDALLGTSVSVGSSTYPAGVDAFSPTGTGGYGVFAKGDTALYGNSTGVQGYGVLAIANSSSGTGVYGSGLTGVSGYGGTGVSGQGSCSSCTGVSGSSNSWYGVLGSSASGYGVSGQSTSGYGVYGISSSNYGVYGNSSSSYGVYGYSTTGTAIYASATDGEGVSGSSTYADGVEGVSTYWDGVFGKGPNYGVFSDGPLGSESYQSAAVALPDDRVVELYAMQSPENWLEDFGSGQLRDGLAEVALDPTFALTVNTGAGYHVFLTPKGDCEGLYVTDETATGFRVRELRGGKSNIAFDYRIVAKRRGYEDLRMAQLEADAETLQAIREVVQSRPAQRKLILHKPAEAPKAPPAPPKVGVPPAPPAVAIPKPPALPKLPAPPTPPKVAAPPAAPAAVTPKPLEQPKTGAVPAVPVVVLPKPPEPPKTGTAPTIRAAVTAKPAKPVRPPAPSEPPQN